MTGTFRRTPVIGRDRSGIADGTVSDGREQLNFRAAAALKV
jgi:hypothetical protein